MSYALMAHLCSRSGTPQRGPRRTRRPARAGPRRDESEPGQSATRVQLQPAGSSARESGANARNGQRERPPARGGAPIPCFDTTM